MCALWDGVARGGFRCALGQLHRTVDTLLQAQSQTSSHTLVHGHTQKRQTPAYKHKTICRDGSSQKIHTDTAQPNFLPRHSETEYIECQMLLHTAWHLYCSWVSATVTHLTCAVSDLHSLLPDLSSHLLQIPGISLIFCSSYSVF